MRSLAAVTLFLTLAGCGYIGEPLPPALKRPVRTTDVSAVERGSNIIIQFTIPKVTTEGLPVRGNEDIDLRVGPAENPFQYEAWERTAERVAVPKSDKPTAYVVVPAAKWYGKTVVINVNVRGPHGRSAGPSNFRILPVVEALPKPEALTARDAPDAVLLEWRAAADEFRIFRRPSEDQPLVLLASSAKPAYLDSMIEYGKSYSYYVQSVRKTGDDYAESEIAEILGFKPVDKFAPAVPAGLSPVPGTRTIELVWDRNTEKDFASYRIFRDGVKLADGLTAPAYSDRDVKPGVKYRYQVSAVDTTGNESAKSPFVESALP